MNQIPSWASSIIADSPLNASPFGPAGLKQDPFGPSAGGFRQPDPYQNQFMFSQNPTTPMTPPSMGIGEGGTVIGSPDMQPQLTQMGGQSGFDFAKAQQALGMAQNAMKPPAQQQTGAQLGGAPSASYSQPRPVPLEFANLMLELMRGRAKGR